MGRPRMLIWGANPAGHGLVVLDALLCLDQYDVVGFIDDREELRGSHILGRSVLGTWDGIRASVLDRVDCLALGVGDNRLRSGMFARARETGLSLPAVVHPAAHVSRHAGLEESAFVAAGGVVCPGARIGVGAIVNTGASADHNCVLGAFSQIAPGVHLGGRVTVGEGAFVGTGASVIPDVTVGPWAVVGAGACVVRDVGAGVTVMGVPAVPKARQ